MYMCVSIVPAGINGSSGSVEELSVIIGTSTELHCPVTGLPQPAVHWRRDGHTITFVDHPNVRVDDAGQTLRLHNMQLIDIGSYTCIASNVAGNASKQFILNILGQYIILLCLRNKRHHFYPATHYKR